MGENHSHHRQWLTNNYNGSIKRKDANNNSTTVNNMNSGGYRSAHGSGFEYAIPPPSSAVSEEEKTMNNDGIYEYHLGKQPILNNSNSNNNNNVFGTIGAGISPAEAIWRMDVYGIAERRIENSSCSSNNNNKTNRVVVQPKYRFVDIAIGGGGGNSSGSTTGSTNGRRSSSKSKLLLSTINNAWDESLQRYGRRSSLPPAPAQAQAPAPAPAPVPAPIPQKSNSSEVYQHYNLHLL